MVRQFRGLFPGATYQVVTHPKGDASCFTMKGIAIALKQGLKQKEIRSGARRTLRSVGCRKRSIRNRATGHDHPPDAWARSN